MSKVRYLYVMGGGSGTYRGRDAETILAQWYTKYVGIVPIPKGTRKERMLFMYAALKKHTSKPGELMLVREPRRNKEKHSRYIQQLVKYGITQAIRRPNRRAVARLAQARARQGATSSSSLPGGRTLRMERNVPGPLEASAQASAQAHQYWEAVNSDGVPAPPPQTPTARQFNPEPIYRVPDWITEAAANLAQGQAGAAGNAADQANMQQAGYTTEQISTMEGILGRR